MTAAVAELPAETIIHLRGENIASFLQGQFTCDLRALSADRAVPGAMCNVKGRVLSDFWVLHAGADHCILRLRRSVADSFASNLKRYAQFSRIEVQADTRSLCVAGLLGAGADLVPLAPIEVGGCAHTPEAIIVRTSTCAAQIVLREDVASERIAPVIAEAGVVATPSGADSWYASELREGHLGIEKDDVERFTPQALNYDLTGRVAFDKGCYTGQEVVARLHYKGASKRRLQVFEHEGDRLASELTELVDGAGKRYGEVLRTVSDGSGRTIVAAMIGSADLDTSIALASGGALKPLERPGDA